MVKKCSGISLISVVITIVAIVIVAAIAIYSSYDTPNSALFTEFTTEVSDIKISLGINRANNLIKDDENKDFVKVKIVNAPSDFISFPSETGEVIGYAIDINKLDYKTDLRGYQSVVNGTVTFDTDDIYVYDKNGSVFYAKGYRYSDKIFYNSTVFKLVKGGE